MSKPKPAFPQRNPDFRNCPYINDLNRITQYGQVNIRYIIGSCWNTEFRLISALWWLDLVEIRYYSGWILAGNLS